MGCTIYDKKAVTILFSTYWSSAGWKKDRVTSPEDLAYAKSKGVMFDARTIQHDEVVKSARAMAGEIGHTNIAQAFLASLSNRELAYRSALGSFAASCWLPNHKYSNGRFQYSCCVCGDSSSHSHEDLNVLNFERLKWGGIRHDKPYYAWFDLAEFRKLPVARPTDSDTNILKRVLATAASQPAEARPNDLEQAIAKLFPSSKSERRIVLQILGYCGILQPQEHQTYFQNYPVMDERAQPNEHKNDWSFPFLWWRGRDGVNTDAVKFYFPNL